MNDEQKALDEGIDGADPVKARERADVKRWFKDFDAARKHDEEPRKQYAIDRRYARGDSGFEVDANLIGNNIDILEAFTYAKNPDIDVVPAVAIEPPDADSLLDAATKMVENDPMAQQAGQIAVQTGIADPATVEALKQQAIQQRAGMMMEEMRKRYDKRMRDAKCFAETIEIITSRMWRDANLKRRGRQWTRSALSVGIGWLKASWQERTAPSAETVQQVNDLQTEIARLKALKQEQEDAHGDELEASLAEHERILATLQAQQQPVIARGYVIDVVPPEDIQVAPGVPIADYLDAPWIAHIFMVPLQDAIGQFSLTKDEASKCDKFRPRKPIMGKDESANAAKNVTAEDASRFVSGSAGDECEAEYVMGVEFWDATSGTVLTGIKGLCRWAKPAWTPTATERFYPFFGFMLNEVDGQRHPQSLVSRSAKLADEYNRIGSQERVHRKRCLPQIVFDKSRLSHDDLKDITMATTGEWVGLDLTDQRGLREVMAEKPYPKLDPMLYDRSRIVNEMERIWGVQEALSGSIDVEKTATEAEIQQSGFNARNGGRRDIMETTLGELAQYTAEVAHAHVTLEDAQAIAGPDAFWPQYTGPESMRAFVNVDIRAGSSGKPNTAADRAAWAALYPTLAQTVQQVAQLRMSSPLDLADALVALADLTAKRSGDDRLDVNQLMPKAGPAPVMGAMPAENTGGGGDGPEQGQPGGQPAGNDQAAGGQPDPSGGIPAAA